MAEPAKRSVQLAGWLLALLPGWGCAALGRLRLARGHYDRWALRLLHAAWCKSHSGEHLIAWIRWRRALGRAMPRRIKHHLLHALDDAGARSRLLAVNMLLENWPEILAQLPGGLLPPLADKSPPVAAALMRQGRALSGTGEALARLHANQARWRDEFVSQVRDNAGSICVVGNAGSLQGQRLGAAIDSHRLVVRFNRFASEVEGALPAEQTRLDVGGRTDVWVRTLELSPPYPGSASAARWILVSGADLRYLADRWDHLVPLLATGHKVLTVPLPVWGELVGILEAPPSAGVLTLAWLMKILPDKAQIAATGFQLASPVGTRYHYALKGHKAGRRHDWSRERRLLNQWQSEGLRFLPSKERDAAV